MYVRAAHYLLYPVTLQTSSPLSPSPLPLTSLNDGLLSWHQAYSSPSLWPQPPSHQAPNVVVARHGGEGVVVVTGCVGSKDRIA